MTQLNDANIRLGRVWSYPPTHEQMLIRRRHLWCFPKHADKCSTANVESTYGF